jgi:hypothetical protein
LKNLFVANYTKGVVLINELTAVAEVGIEPRQLGGQRYRSFGAGRRNLSFVGDRYIKFQKAIEKLHNLERDVCEGWSIKTFENRVIYLIQQLKHEKRKCSLTDVETFFIFFKSSAIKEFEIVYRLFGIELTGSENKLGEFTIYDYEAYKNLYYDKLDEPGKHVFSLFEPKGQYLLSIKVRARESVRAVEMGDILAGIFESAFNYMVADFSFRREAGIFKYKGWQSVDRLIRVDNLVSYQSTNTNISLPINLRITSSKRSTDPNAKIWGLISKPNKSELDRKLLNCIESVGDAIREKDFSKSLVRLIFAIEGMLQHHNNEFIPPSIVNHIGDSLAFIISDKADKRKEVIKYFKDVYKKRSSVVHADSKIINGQDVVTAFELCNLMITRFLMIPPFCEMKTMKELHDYLSELKYR